MVISAAGLCCTDYSPLGKQSRDAGQTEVYHHVWHAERVRAAEMNAESLFFTECSALYPAGQKQAETLSSQYQIVHVVTSPDKLGFPVRRSRSFTAGVNRAEYVWCGATTPEAMQLEFDLLFGRSCMLTGDAFFNAELEEVQGWVRKMCKRRKASIPEDLLRQEPVGNLLPFILAPSFVTRLQTYKRLAAQKSGLDGSFLCDLEQNPGFGPGSGLLFPSMCTHPCIFSMKMDRVALAGECLAAQGLDMYPTQWGDRGSSPLRDLFRDFDEKHVLFMAGNSIHVPTFLCFMLYILGNIERRDDLSKLPHPVAAASSSRHAVDDADEQVQSVQDARKRRRLRV